jgi:hypothetical protein
METTMLEEVYTLFCGELTTTVSVPVQTAMSMRYAPKTSKAAHIEIYAVFFTANPRINDWFMLKGVLVKVS